MSDILPFTVRYEDQILVGDHHAGSSPRQVLLIHGAGASSRASHATLRAQLQARGIGSSAFDCVGHGDTGGAMEQSSLASRTRQAQAVLAARGLAPPLALIGSSMGAYNAVRMAQTLAPAALILIVPGMFTPAAYELPFGPRFSSVIRRERSWVDSDAWDIVVRFKGDFLVIAAEHDAVIPREIPERLFAAAGQARSRRLHVVPGTDHRRLFSFMAERPALLDETMELIVDCIQGTAAAAAA